MIRRHKEITVDLINTEAIIVVFYNICIVMYDLNDSLSVGDIMTTSRRRGRS